MSLPKLTTTEEKKKANFFSPNWQMKERLIRLIRSADKWQNDYHTRCVHRLWDKWVSLWAACCDWSIWRVRHRERESRTEYMRWHPFAERRLWYKPGAINMLVHTSFCTTKPRSTIFFSIGFFVACSIVCVALSQASHLSKIKLKKKNWNEMIRREKRGGIEFALGFGNLDLVVACATCMTDAPKPCSVSHTFSISLLSIIAFLNQIDFALPTIYYIRTATVGAPRHHDAHTYTRAPHSHQHTKNKNSTERKERIIPHIIRMM